MVRTLISIVVPFITPMLCYAVWIWFQARKQERLSHGEALAAWQQWPWIWLVSIGSGLAIVTLLVLFSMSDPLTDDRWVPPAVINGEVIPGHYEPAN